MIPKNKREHIRQLGPDVLELLKAYRERHYIETIYPHTAEAQLIERTSKTVTMLQNWLISDLDRENRRLRRNATARVKRLFDAGTPLPAMLLKCRPQHRNQIVWPYTKDPYFDYVEGPRIINEQAARESAEGLSALFG